MRSKNNFDLIRFLLAVGVFLAHTTALASVDQLKIFEAVSSAIAVKSFFVISGFLIFMSYERSVCLNEYLSKRFRRIYPAYLFVIIFFAIIGFWFSGLKFSVFFSADWVKYIFFNSVFLNFVKPDLPGLFLHNRLAEVNGALWTLKVEVVFYIAVPAIAYCAKKIGRLKLFFILYCVSIIYKQLLGSLDSHFAAMMAIQFPGQLSFFIAGACCYYYQDIFKKYYIWLITVSFFLWFFNTDSYFPIIEPVALAVFVMYFALVFPYVGNFTRYGDFSYGIYILHFPVIQLLVQEGYFAANPLAAIFFAGLIIFLGSFLMWHFIEKRFLVKSSHYLGN
jgi:peptidoglycan/LPS O-acetylase OafA/YrhL